MKCQGFEWEFPLYALAVRDTVTLVDGVAQLDEKIRFIAPEAGSGLRALALFTAQDIAQRFMSESAPQHDLVLFNIPDADSLSNLLKRADGLYQHVLFDLVSEPRGIRHICEFRALAQAAAKERGRPEN